MEINIRTCSGVVGRARRGTASSHLFVLNDSLGPHVPLGLWPSSRLASTHFLRRTPMPFLRPRSCEHNGDPGYYQIQNEWSYLCICLIIWHTLDAGVNGTRRSCLKRRHGDQMQTWWSKTSNSALFHSLARKSGAKITSVLFGIPC